MTARKSANAPEGPERSTLGDIDELNALRAPVQWPRRYFAAPLGAAGVVGAGAGVLGPMPVVEDGFCFGMFGELAVGGMFTPLPAGLLFDANTNSSTAATNTAAATHPHTALTSPVARSNSGRR
jgi:hypothetical protein